MFIPVLTAIAALTGFLLWGAYRRRQKLVGEPRVPVFASAGAAPEGILYQVENDPARHIFLKDDDRGLSVIASDVLIHVDAAHRARLNEFMAGQQQKLIAQKPMNQKGCQTLEIVGEWTANGARRAVLGEVPQALARQAAQVCPTTRIYCRLERITLHPGEACGEMRIALAVNKAAPEFHLQVEGGEAAEAAGAEAVWEAPSAAAIGYAPFERVDEHAMGDALAETGASAEAETEVGAAGQA